MPHAWRTEDPLSLETQRSFHLCVPIPFCDGSHVRGRVARPVDGWATLLNHAHDDPLMTLCLRYTS